MDEPVHDILFVEVQEPLNYLAGVVAHCGLGSFQRPPDVLNQLTEGP